MPRMLEKFFGASPNGRCGELLKQLSTVAVECAEHVKKSGGADLEKVVEFEHRADDSVRAIYELIDTAFILRFDKADVTQLSGEIDDIVDGLRKVATHVALYHPRLIEPSDHARELFDITCTMVQGVANVVEKVVNTKVPMKDLVAKVYELGDLESKADAILIRAQRELVEKQGKDAVTLDLFAYSGMLELLEDVTDHANHCARLVLSMARKEA